MLLTVVVDKSVDKLERMGIGVEGWRMKGGGMYTRYFDRIE